MGVQVPLGWRLEPQEKRLLCQHPSTLPVLSAHLGLALHSRTTVHSITARGRPHGRHSSRSCRSLWHHEFSPLLEYSHQHTNMSHLKKKFFFKKKKTLSNISLSFFPLRANFRETVIYTCYLQPAFPCFFLFLIF